MLLTLSVITFDLIGPDVIKSFNKSTENANKSPLKNEVESETVSSFS